MIVFKNSSGFTLIEVLLALAIIGLILTPIFVSQTSIFGASSRTARVFSQLIAAKKYLLDTRLSLEPDAQEFKSEKKIDAARTTLTYQLRKIPETSALKNFKNVLIESVTWPDAAKKPQRLVTFLYREVQS